MSDPDRQRSMESRIEALFDELVDLPPEAQRERLAARGTADADVVEAVQHLLESLRELPAEFLEGPDDRTAVVDPLMPTRIRDYRVVRRIGEGGMGTVYEGEQLSPRRRVALKVIRPEVASPGIRRRFAREAELLAQLQHPGIAHIYESGDAEIAGRRLPYFAMEYIDGEPLDVYARRKSLGVRQRLELVARVADAVHHAHLKGIVHRDLKPTNVLVVDDDSTRASSTSIDFDEVGQPKVLDFGIARVIEADSELTIQTHAGQIIGTLAYMSPEQVSGDSSRIDTRCDIYALGVILYELLVGRYPLPLADLSLVEAARVIREDEPTSIGSIDKNLRGDVSTIVAKALEKEKERRYLSASEFAADIRRYLNDEPIEARPASTFYQLRKFARRNRALVGGVCATFVVLVLGLLGTGYYLFESNRALEEVERTKQEISKTLYGTRMILGAQAAAKTGALDQVRHVVELTRELPLGEVRGWEWFYLLSECHREAAILDIGGPGGSLTWRPGHEEFAVTTGSTVRVYQAAERRLRWEWPVPGDSVPLTDSVPISWSPDGQHLAVASAVERVTILDGDGKVVRPLEKPGHAAFSLAWSHDGQSLATGTNRELCIWSLTDGGSRSIAIPTRALQVDWSPDDSRLALCDGSGSRALYVVDVESGATRTVPISYGVECVAWRTDGEELLYLTNGGQSGVLDVDLERTRSFDSLRGNRLCLAWKPDGNWVAFSGPPGMVIVHDASGELVASFAGPSDVRSLAWHPLEPRLFSLDEAGGLREWNVERDTRFLESPQRSSPIEAIAWAPDGRRLATARNGVGVQLWDAETQRASGTLPQAALLHSDLAWSPCGRFIAACEREPWTRIWHVATGKEIDRLPRVSSVAWSPDGGRLLLVSALTLTLWRVGGEEIWSLEPGEKQALAQSGSPVAWRPGAEEVAFVNRDLRIVRFDLDTRSTVEEFEGYRGSVSDLAWSPDGRRLVAGTDSGDLLVWEVGRSTPVLTLDGHTRQPTSVSWSPDGTRIASGSEDHAVRVWDAFDGTPLVELTEHSAPIRAVRWSPDGKRLATADMSGRTRIWSAAAGYELSGVATPEAHEVRPGSSPEERYLRARILELTGRPDEAAATWAELERELSQEGVPEVERHAFERRRRHDASIDRWVARQQTLAVDPTITNLHYSDDSWIVARPPAALEFTVTLTASTDSPSTALRIDAVRDIRLPLGGPGWGYRGAFEVAELSVRRVGRGEDEPASLVPIARLFGDPESNVRLEDGRVVGWSVTDPTHDCTLTLELAQPIAASESIEVRLRCAPNLNLGRFRLTATSEPDACDRERERVEGSR